jgi:hypothetical protein
VVVVLSLLQGGLIVSWLGNFLQRRKAVQPLNNTVTLPGMKFEFKLPDMPGVKTTTRGELSFDIPCVLRPPGHKLRIIIVDDVVKAIVSPCSRDEALASTALSGDGCGGPYEGVTNRLKGSTKWGRFSATDDNVLNNAYNHASKVRSEREAARMQHDESFRVSPSIWAPFIKNQTGLVANVSVTSSHAARAELAVQTPLAPSLYRFDNGTWGLASGPGDHRVGELLDKHIKLNGILARYVPLRRLRRRP